MSHAQTSPVCEGSGAINSQPDIPGTTPGRIMSSPCHGCDGKGWVTVKDRMPMLPTVDPPQTKEKPNIWSHPPS